MRCDLHVHTKHSGMCTVPLATTFCRESYAEPADVYSKLKRVGMDLVTITDHDSIGSAEELGRYGDFFVSEEVTCRLPSGTEAHVAVYDVSEPQHVRIQRLRDDLPSLIRYLNEQRLLFSVNHLFSGLTGRRRLADFELFEQFFPCFETLNGAVVARANELAAQFAGVNRKIALGGSDAHTVASAGLACTAVPHARSKREFLDGIRMGRSVAMGSSGGFLRLTRDVLIICSEMFRDKPQTLLLSPLVGGVPMVLLVNYWLEVAFAERWFARATGRKGFALGGAPLNAGEVTP